MTMRRDNSGAERRRGFTLTELMVAIAVLLVVIIATGKIFGTASQVTGIGQATADVQQEAAALERQLRQDFEDLSTEGFFVIRQVVLPNDYNIVNGSGAGLLDPRRPADAVVRADQLMFFTQGVRQTQIYAEGAAFASRSQVGLTARVTYGHGYSVPELGPNELPATAGVQNGDEPWYRGIHTPWYEGPVQWFRPSPPGGGTVQHLQIPATQWLMSRQSVIMADDGGDVDSFFVSSDGGGTNSAATITSEDIRRSRYDIAAAHLIHVRDDILNKTFNDGWDAARYELIGQDYLFYPRAERSSASMLRSDFSPTVHTIGAACSSIKIEWTYKHEVGLTANPNINALAPFRGAIVPADWEQPWFGLKDGNIDTVGEDALTFAEWQTLMAGEFGFDPDDFAIFPEVIESSENIDFGGGLQDDTQAGFYMATFGYNRTEALDPETEEPDADMIFTPWPSAVRITVVLHDTDARLSEGRTFQFVIDLPERSE